MQLGWFQLIAVEDHWPSLGREIILALWDLQVTTFGCIRWLSRVNFASFGQSIFNRFQLSLQINRIRIYPELRLLLFRGLVLTAFDTWKQTVINILKSIATHPCCCIFHRVWAVLVKKLWLQLNSVTKVYWFAFRALIIWRESLFIWKIMLWTLYFLDWWPYCFEMVKFWYIKVLEYKISRHSCLYSNLALLKPFFNSSNWGNTSLCSNTLIH